MIPVLIASLYKVMVIWDITKKWVWKDVGTAFVQGFCIGYFANEACNYGGTKWHEAVSIVAGTAAFMANWIGILIFKNRWKILKAKTGLDGEEKE